MVPKVKLVRPARLVRLALTRPSRARLASKVSKAFKACRG